MGSGIDIYVQLLKKLNSAPGYSLPKSQLQALFSINSSELEQAVENLNSIDDYIENLPNNLRLKSPVDFLNETYIYSKVKGKGRVEVLDTIGSTNTEMLNRAGNVASGDVLLAEHQYSGRGRRANKWTGAIGKQLTLSIGFSFPPEHSCMGFSIAVGAAVASALDAIGIKDVFIKWPNDIYVLDRKLGGILIESIPREHDNLVVVGLGMNVYSWKDNVLNSDYACLNNGLKCPVKRDNLAVKIIDALRVCQKQFAIDGLSQFLDGFNKKDYLKGRRVKIDLESSSVEGIADGITSDGHLLLKTQSGVEQVSIGHVSLL
ncbi:MAG TPA: biotin--[acetyl-CoA-carboxylase] ligase [Succinivibrionaceae bacterium]|nr:biotin--[acetyl-CoA-carboxylase] ligase [Succinivibrionaceae bacterium]